MKTLCSCSHCSSHSQTNLLSDLYLPLKVLGKNMDARERGFREQQNQAQGLSHCKAVSSGVPRPVPQVLPMCLTHTQKNPSSFGGNRHPCAQLRHALLCVSRSPKKDMALLRYQPDHGESQARALQVLKFYSK